MRRFATNEVAQDLQESGFTLGGKRVNATVMFADIRSFTSMSEMIELLNVEREPVGKKPVAIGIASDDVIAGNTNTQRRATYTCNAIHAGGSAAIRKAGWPLPGQVKHEWARRIAPDMNAKKTRHKVSANSATVCADLPRDVAGPAAAIALSRLKR